MVGVAAATLVEEILNALNTTLKGGELMPKLSALETVSREIAFARAVVNLAREHGMLSKVGRRARTIAAGKAKATPKRTRRARRHADAPAISADI